MSRPTDDNDLEYDADSDTYRTTYEVGRENLSVRILEAVGAIRDTDPTELEPLDTVIKPDSLNDVFEPTQEKEGAHGSISFTYEGLLIIAHSDGEIELRESV